MNRRGFLAGILAAGMAPAVVRAASLMKVVSQTRLIMPAPFGFHDNFARAVKHFDHILTDDPFLRGLYWTEEQRDVMRCMTKGPILINRFIVS